MIKLYIELIWAVFNARKRLKRRQKECSKAVNNYLQNNEICKLQIGTGPNKLMGWFNTDISPSQEGIYHLDAAKPFPLKDNSFDYIFSEHQIEHLTYSEGLEMLKECYRILKPKGKVRLITPDIDIIISLRNKEKSDIQKDYVRWHIENFFPDMSRDRDIFVINNAFSGFGHRFLYDFETLRESLQKVGFKNCIRKPYGESDDQNLRGIDWRASDRMTSFTGLCVEAEKI